MNSETGEIKRIPESEKLKPPWVEITEPNPECKRCKGKGSILDGNRKERRHNLRPMEYVPCPECSGKKPEIVHTHTWEPGGKYQHIHKRGNVPHGHHGSRYKQEEAT